MSEPVAASPRISLVMEWANARLNGAPRAYRVLEELGRQWQEIVDRIHPADLPSEAADHLETFDPRLELLIVSGEVLSEGVEEDLRGCVVPCFDLRIHVAPGLEYYPLKTQGARLSCGDILLFVDCDVLPDRGWFAHLLGTFARPDVAVVSGLPYVGASDLVSRAFALGWTYELPDPQQGLVQRKKVFANNIAFRREVFFETGFPEIGIRTRGASSRMAEDLRSRGIPVWQNYRAAVDHPPPSSLSHLVVRALAHGRDHYMKFDEERSWAGLERSVRLSVERLSRGCRNAFTEGHRVGLRPYEIPAVMAILGTYYGFFALGGIATHVSPARVGRSFRI